jgi:peptide chain release factor 1|tara:strand:+ start:10661 stop:11725 length:1065 start_codon:yes stop_codon:yes gene_type:complete
MIEQKIRKELESAKIEVGEIDLKLNSNTIKGDEIIQLSKKRSQLIEIVTLYDQLVEIETSIEENRELLSDKEFKSLAEEELTTLETKLTLIEDKIKFEVRPKDPLDSKDVIIEIRAGAGGDEAALFASDLLRMYLRYCERKKWNMEIINKSEIGLGGVKEVIASISGKDIYSFMKFESGVHRVQRVPATETSGRVHTSTATVVVLPEADDVEIEIHEKDLRVDTYRASGAGGQHVNKTDSAVRLTHIPSGIVVQNQDGKSQHQNRQRAMRVLNAKLFEAQQDKKQEDMSKTRKLLVGGGDRSEKIRTYNFAQSRVSDHRINLTLHKLDYILDGDLDELNNELYKNYIKEESGVS